MQLSKLFSTLALGCAVLSVPSYGSFFDEVDGQFDMGHHIAENAVGFLPVPIIITEPAVGYGGGLVGIFMHETEHEKQRRKQAALTSLDGGAQLMPASITAVGAAGTKNGSWFAFAGHRHSWLDDSIRYIGGAGVGKINLDIYQDVSFPGGLIPGVGGKLPSFNTTFGFNTQTTGAAMLQSVQFRVAKTPLMLGVKQLASYTSVESSNGVINQILEWTLGKESVISGLGVTAEYDTRNNLFYPTSGFKVAADYMVYDEKIGSASNYQKFSLEGQGYIPIAKKWTMAFAGDYENFSTEELFIAPTAQPYIKLRGVQSYRYQGDEIATLQSQVTYDIDHRWKVSAFYGVGEAKQDNSLSDNTVVDAYGAGFRYQLARRYGLYMGVDVARSEGENAFYINLGSGF
ncbi:BamA/TamA family outer membrane protein [Vibrio sp. SCSIO 43135]|uniref:BamA/TamA family outer membrane protein n=1 Tax=Vibrio sp. SCSIO 43135 TaxID=2819096 RepID=UPI0020760533|nr:BamA/TamA family outer membrane protein [Vibrio sp. SCSIO 43135]USD43342.1 BamA/TamA family outer membrane protein [Vibrio sp. SCSIO 43135]